MDRNHKTFALTIYLIKNTYSNVTVTDLVRADLTRENIGDIGKFFFKKNTPKTPKWISLFDGYKLPNFLYQSVSGLFITKVDNNYFAIAFGPEGRHFIKPGLIEERFGLITTLNSVKSESIRSLDTKTLESEGMKTLLQSSRPVSPDSFDFDAQKDLLRGAVGESEDPSLGKILAGKDSLRASLSCDLTSLQGLLTTLLNNYKKSDYKTKFPWVDNLREIKDPTKVDELNTRLLTEINKESPAKLWLTVPDIIDWADHGGFKYSTNKRDENLMDDIHIKSFKEYLKKNVVFLEDLTSNTLARFSQASEYTKEHWRIYDCTYFEYSEGNETYFLTSGRWYAVSNSLVEQVKTYYTNISREKFGIIFPEYDHPKEKDFNKDLAMINNALLIDADNLIIEGKSKFEFCDVYTKDRKLIHIKKYSGSSALSHLFNQGFVSANLMFDKDIRTKINSKLLSGEFLFSDLTKRPNTDNNNYTVIFGIISKTDSDLDIPFFSKMTLMHVTKDLQNLGFKVSLVKIKNLRPDTNDN